MRCCSSLAILLLAGCPEVGRITYRFDLAHGAGSLSFEDIGTDEASAAASDFAEIVNEWVLGSKIQDQHPHWKLGERKLLERDGRLDGLVLFSFDTPGEAGLYQHDRKSPYLWCAGEGERIVETSGSVIAMYPSCVVFDRKTKLAEVTVTNTSEGAHTSLVGQFRVWDGAPIADLTQFDSATINRMLDDAMGGGTGTESFDLGSLLPTTDAGPLWTALGLPLVGGKTVLASDVHLQVAHSGLSAAELITRYGAALAAAGYHAVSEGEEEATWAKETDELKIVATPAGSTVIISLAR